MSELKELVSTIFTTATGVEARINLSYHIFGKALGTAPVVLVNHALTGNSEVAGENGWWKSVIGDDKPIDTIRFTVLAFNFPGNGFDQKPENLIHNYKDFDLNAIANILFEGLDSLGIEQVYCGIGGSVGGALLWHMAAIRPQFFEKIIPVGCDFKATDWLRALCKIQDDLLQDDKRGIHLARQHGMTFYRCPEGLNHKFQNKKTQGLDSFMVEDWLNYHGCALEKRFQLAAYKLMNHLLSTVDISTEELSAVEVAASIISEIHVVTVDSDLLFTAHQSRLNYQELKGRKNEVYYYEIESIHGHDAILIEYPKLSSILERII